jgi:hypothetical protein
MSAQAQKPSKRRRWPGGSGRPRARRRRWPGGMRERPGGSPPARRRCPGGPSPSGPHPRPCAPASVTAEILTLATIKPRRPASSPRRVGWSSDIGFSLRNDRVQDRFRQLHSPTGDRGADRDKSRSRSSVRGSGRLFGRCRGCCLKPSVEGLTLLRHLSEKLRRLEALAVLLRVVLTKR